VVGVSYVVLLVLAFAAVVLLAGYAALRLYRSPR